MQQALVGVIGGSGLYQMDALQDAQELDLSTPYGKPSPVLATGTLQTTLATECKRCLKPLALATDFEMEEEFKSTVDVLTGTALPVDPAEDTALLIDAQHILNLGEIIRQVLLLAAEPVALCRPDCRGLCPNCGSDLNEGPYGCQTEIEDPRWAALSRLLKT